MEVIESKDKVRKLLIKGVPGLDSIHVFLEDLEPRQGQIIIKCYDESWTSYWGGMGDRTIAQFFCSCDNDYLAKNIAGNISSSVIDEDKSIEYLKNRIIECRKGCCENGNTFDSDEAREAWDDLSRIENPKEWLMTGNDLVCKLIGDEWWYNDLPEKTNPKYEYLCRIIDAIKKALSTELLPKRSIKGHLIVVEFKDGSKEGVFFTDKNDADDALNGIGSGSALAVAFTETYGDSDCKKSMIEIEI